MTTDNNEGKPAPYGGMRPMEKADEEQTAKLMRALSEKYGKGTMMAGLHLSNLNNIINTAFSADHTKLDAGSREHAITTSKFAVRVAISFMAPGIGACCEEHVEACAQSFMDFTAQLAAAAHGEKLEGGEAEAKEVLARVRA